MSEETRYLTFALGKGRLANKTLELLEEIGITCEEMKDKESRKLIFVNEEQKLKFFLAKGPDGSRLWKMQNVCLRSAECERTSAAPRNDPCCL